LINDPYPSLPSIKEDRGILTSTNSVYDSDDLFRAILASQGLVLGDNDETEFLTAIKKLTKADGIAIPRWLPGDHSRIEVSKLYESTKPPDNFLVDDFLPFIDLVADQHPELPSRIDTATPAQKGLHPTATAFVSNPRTLCVLLDSDPANILIILTRNSDSQTWDASEQQSFMEFAKVMRKSVRQHKLLDDTGNVIKAARYIFNSVPGGMLTILPDGSVPMANRVATEITLRDDTLTLQDGRLTIKDKDIQADFLENLDSLTSLSAPDISDYSRHYLLKRTQGDGVIQMSMHAIQLPEWHLESRLSAMVILIYLIDPQNIDAPDIELLKNIYKFTDAQAKVAVALWGGTSIHDAAESLCISVNTARTHLRSIYQKAGVGNHAELMANMTGTLARLGSIGKSGQYYRWNRYIDC